MKSLFTDINNVEYKIRNYISELSNSSSIIDIQTLNTKIKNDLELLNTLIKKANNKIFEKNNSNKQKQYAKELSFHKEELNNLTILQRKLHLKASNNLQDKYKQDRRELLAGATNLAGNQITNRFQNGTREDIIKSSLNITKSLERTRSFMNSQVTRSTQMLEELEDSSKILDKSVGQQKEYGNRTMEAKSLITNLKRRDMTDKLLIYFGLLLFISTVLYIFKVRFGSKFMNIFYATPPPDSIHNIPHSS